MALPKKERIPLQSDCPFYFLHLSFTKSNFFALLATHLNQTITVLSSGKFYHNSEKKILFVTREVISQLIATFNKNKTSTVKIIVAGNQSSDCMSQIEEITQMLADQHVRVLSVNFKTELPHNGCKLKKRRRV